MHTRTNLSVAERLRLRLRRQLAATARFAEMALNVQAGLGEILQAACQAACDGSGISRSKVLLHDPARNDLIIRAGIGWHAGVVGMHVPAHPRTAPGATLRSGQPLVVGDLYAEPGLDVHEPLKSHGIISVANVPVALNGTVLGVLELDSTECMALGDDDVAFLKSLAGPVAAAIMRANYEQAAIQTEQRLRQNEERLTIALSAARMGTWLLHLSTNQHIVDDSLRQLMGIAPEQPIRTYQDWLSTIHPEDQPAVAAAFQRSIDEGVELDTEFRIVHPHDGSVRWIKDQGRVFLDNEGRPLFMAGACVDITERKGAELLLRRADRVKTEFLAMLAHELRNPLAPLKNAVALLDRGTDNPQRTQAALGIMHRQLLHLSRLMADLLEISRIEQGKIELRIESVVLAQVVGAAIETVQPMIEARGQRLSVALPGAELRIAADAVRLTQVVANLLQNAAKFTPQGGAIEVAVEEREHEVAIRVRDEGVGISEEMLPHIFKLFEQGENQSLDRSQGGLGIGLALVKRLVGMHGGTVEAHSGGLGHGATFIVRLPYAPQS